MAINADWHRKNRMPKNPTTEQRVAWHLEHAKACSCRPIPEKLAALVAAHGGGKPKATKKPRSR
ncbi:MAG TPA: hypothetical protein VGK67_22745 [Myxococcales bacterium]